MNLLNAFSRTRLRLLTALFLLAALSGCNEEAATSSGEPAQIGEPERKVDDSRSFSGGPEDFKPPRKVNTNWGKMLTELLERDPRTEANEDFAHGERGLYTAVSVGEYTPGLTREQAAVFNGQDNRSFPMVFSPATSNAQAAYTETALNFIRFYNQRKLELLQAAQAAGL